MAIHFGDCVFVRPAVAMILHFACAHRFRYPKVTGASSPPSRWNANDIAVMQIDAGEFAQKKSVVVVVDHDLAALSVRG